MPKANQTRSNALTAAPGATLQDPKASGARRMSAAEAAEYIADFSAELALLAREANLDLLAYMLDMARLEATEAARGK